VPFFDMGEQEAKNLPQPIHVFRIKMARSGQTIIFPGKQPKPDSGSTARTPSVTDRRDGGSFGAGLILGAVALVAAASALGVVLWREFSRPAPAIVANIPTPPVAPPPEVPRELKPPPATPTTPQATPSKPPEPPRAPEIKPVEAKPPEPPRADPPAQAASRPSAEQQAEKIAEAAPSQATPPTPIQPPPKTVAVGPIEPPQLTPAPPTPQPPTRPYIPPGTNPSDTFSIFSKAGGIIPDAKTAPELYHNARSYEARGEAANARTEYMKLAELGTDFLDPHLRFAALLRAQDGRAGAREIYARLAEGKGGRVAAIVHALQYEGAERRARVAALAGQHALYGPVHMLLADEYSTERVGGETIGERRSQFAALQKFLDADRNGALSQYFLDHSVLAQWLDRARSRQQALEQFLKTAKLEPTAQFMHTNSGWMANIWVPEPATKISWRANSKAEFTPTGETGFIDQRTGKPSPLLSFQLPRDSGEATIEIRYEDAIGEVRGPFPIKFEPRTELVKSQRDLLQRFSNNWISFGDGGSQSKFVYFTQLVAYRCAIEKVVLVFDDSPLPMQLRLPPCDPNDPLTMPASFRPFVAMPASAKSLTIEIAYADGTVSEKRKFEKR